MGKLVFSKKVQDIIIDDDHHHYLNNEKYEEAKTLLKRFGIIFSSEYEFMFDKHYRFMNAKRCFLSPRSGNIYYSANYTGDDVSKYTLIGRYGISGSNVCDSGGFIEIYGDRLSKCYNEAH